MAVPKPAVLLERARVPAEGSILAALAYEPAVSASRPPVVLGHGYTSSKESIDVVASYLCSRGWPCLTFDFRGHKLGGSSGRMETVDDAVLDAVAAVEFAAVRWHVDGVFFVGHSLGGAAGLAAAASSRLILGGAALGVSDSFRSGFDGPVGLALMEQRGDYVDGAHPERILAQGSDLCRKAASEWDGRPVLMVAARADPIVRPPDVRKTAGTFGSRAEFLIVEGGHLDLPIRARGFVANWLERVSDEC